jgi:hypothetical protein
MATFGSITKGFFKKQNLEYAELFLKVLAFLVGGYWTIYIFKYQYEILPESEPTSLVLKSSIKQVGTLDTLIFYQIELTMQNKSKSRIKIPASYYNIVGNSIQKFIYDDKRFAPNKLGSDALFHNNFFSYDTSSSLIVQTDKILEYDSYISPESEFQIQHTFAVSKKRFETLTVTISTISAKKNANIITKWEYDNVGRISAHPYVVKTHIFGKNDTILYNSSKEKPLGEKYDIYFTTIVNDYFLNKTDSVK